MKKAINVWSFPGDWALERKMQVAREAGFAGFEIEMAEDGPVNLKSGSTELTAVRLQAEKAQLRLCGLATGLYWKANAASAEAAIRERAAYILQRQIECAAALGIDTILVVPGAVGVDFIPGAEEVRYDRALARATEFIRAALPHASKHRVCMAIENVWNKFLLSPIEMRSFVNAMSSEWVGCYLDVGNVLTTGYPEHWIELLAARVRRVHFKDYRRAIGTVDGFVDLLSGDVNWPAVMRALRSINYDNWISAEMIPPSPFYKHCPETLIHNTSRAMDGIFALGL